MPQRPFGVSQLLQKRTLSAQSVARSSGGLLKRPVSVENLTKISGEGSSTWHGDLDKAITSRSHAYEIEPAYCPLYLPALETKAFKDISLRASALLRVWMDKITDTPVQSIFVGTPSVTVEKFMEHLMIMLRRMKLEAFSIIHVLHYIQTISKTGKFVVSWKNVFRLLLASAVVTTKYYTDERLYNSDFAGIIGLPVADINRLESGFLAIMEFDLFAEEHELMAVRAEYLQVPVVVGPDATA